MMVRTSLALIVPILLIAESIQDKMEDWNTLSSHSLALSPFGERTFSDYYKEVNEQLDVQKEICKVSQIHGFQNRTGFLPYTLAFQHLLDVTFKFLDDWHQHRHRSHTYLPPFPAASCKRWISHKYKFIYTGIPKTGYRSTKEYLIKAACNGTMQGCMEMLAESQMTEEEYTNVYNSYFKFMFVRNPYDRVASAYYMMSNPMRNDNGRKCIPPFDQHCQDPYKLKELCGKHYPFIETHNSTGDCCCYVKNQLNQKFLDQHLMPQSPCAFDKDGQSLVDFIGRVENYKEDLVTILNEINKRNEVQIPVPEEVLHVGRFSDSDNQSDSCEFIAKAYQELFNENPQCLQPIRKYYYLDFKLLKFDSDM